MNMSFDPGPGAPEGPFVADTGIAGAAEGMAEAGGNTRGAVNGSDRAGRETGPPGDAASDGELGGVELGGVETIEIVSAMFREVVEELHHLRAKLRRGETEEVKDTVRVVRDLRAASLLVLEERNKVDKLRKEIAGNVGAGALDLAAARDEIGRRLACLRRAAGG